MANEKNHLTRPLRNMLRLIESFRVGVTEGKMFDEEECEAIEEAEELCRAAEIDGVKALKRLRGVRDMAKAADKYLTNHNVGAAGAKVYEIIELAESFIDETEKRFL